MDDRPQASYLIGRLFNTGRVDFTRTVAVTGSEVLKPAYCKLQVGALLTNVFAGNVTKDKDLRYISGNVLTGKQVSPNGFLGAFHSQLTVIPEVTTFTKCSDGSCRASTSSVPTILISAG